MFWLCLIVLIIGYAIQYEVGRLADAVIGLDRLYRVEMDRQRLK